MEKKKIADAVTGEVVRRKGNDGILVSMLSYGAELSHVANAPIFFFVFFAHMRARVCLFQQQRRCVHGSRENYGK